MNITILDNYDKIIEEKTKLIANTNAIILLASGGVALFVSTSLIPIALLSGLNMIYIIKKILNNRENNNLSKKDIMFLNSLAYIYNTDYKKIKKHLNKNLLSKENITKAYKRRAKVLHPDMTNGNQKKFQELVNHKNFIETYLKEFKYKNK